MGAFWSGFLRENFSRPAPETYTLPDGRPRLAFVDLAKGIAIIMVMLTHTHDFSPTGFTFYRMPLYWIVCGLFFKEKITLPDLIVRKANRLLVPMIFFTIIGMLLYIAVGRPLPDMAQLYTDPLAIVRGVNGPMWFMYSLFTAYILLWMVCCMFRSVVMRVVLVCLLAYVSGDFNFQSGEFGMFTAMAALPYMFVGYLLRGCRRIYTTNFDTMLALAGAAVFCIVEYAVMNFGVPNVGFGSNIVKGSRPLMYLLSISGTIGLLCVVKRVAWLPVISYFGRYSIVPLCIHFPLMITLWELRDHHGCSWLADPVFTIVFFLILWLLIPFFVKYFPRICAQRDLFRLRKH